MKLTVLQMKCFVSLVYTKKQAETAAILGIQPSTVSKYIEHMENEYSVKLFRKSSSGMELTKEGMLIYPALQLMLKQHEDLITQMSAFSTKWQASINIVSMFHQSDTLKLLNEFSKANPDIELSISERSVLGAQLMLRAQSVDAGIIYREFMPKKYINTFPIKEEKLVAVVNKNHPLASRDTISVSELKNERFILFRGDYQMYFFLLHACINAGFVPDEVNMDLRICTIIEFLKCNLGVSMLMENLYYAFQDESLTTINLVEAPKLTMSLIVPIEYPSKPCEKLIDFLIAKQNR